ncbi:MAG: sigma-70 family RNA polymerase sigma factor [Bacteroidales bacterium]|nr:sigma-70 family RNA polymerase sigma factor [Bacteroidales bacterium]
MFSLQNRHTNEMGKEEFEKTVFILKDKLFRFARRIINNTDDAEDVVQELMIVLWNKRTELKKFKNIEAYAMRSVKNMSIDKLKHYKVRQDKMQDIKDINPQIYNDLSNEKNEMSKLIRTAIEGLPEKQKLVMHLRDIEGYSFEEMETVLEMNIVALRVNLSRARKQVKEQILKIVNYGL